VQTLSTQTLQTLVERHPETRGYWIAYSGGMDSHVLLHLCASLRDAGCSARFRAVHVHHGLQAGADAWSEHCATVCDALAIPLLTLRVDARAQPGESPEEAARKARYRAIVAHLSAGEALLAAQHRDDQAETLLLQLLRGAGLAGLAAMPAWAPFGPGFLARPLLEYSRTDLRAYAQTHGLSWIEDPSNADQRYDRNFLRERVIPVLTQRWPGFGKSLGRSARHCAEAERRLGELAEDLYRLALRADGLSLSVEKLRGFHATDRKLVLRQWLKSAGARMTSEATLDRILHEAVPAAADKNPAIRWPEGEVRRYRDGLYLLPPLPPFDAGARMKWDGETPLTLRPDNGELSVAPTMGNGIAPEAWKRAPLSVHYRQGGERCRLPGREGAHELKKLFQEAGIPPWIRERVPLIYVGEDLAAAGDFWVCLDFAGRAGERNLALTWRRPF
jgi:tRNA(Ile)-lysidine synthase